MLERRSTCSVLRTENEERRRMLLAIKLQVRSPPSSELRVRTKSASIFTALARSCLTSDADTGGMRDANNPLAPVKRRSKIIVMFPRTKDTVKRIAAALSVALLLSVVAAFGLNGWTVLSMGQQSGTVACESGAGCKASPVQLR